LLVRERGVKGGSSRRGMWKGQLVPHRLPVFSRQHIWAMPSLFLTLLPSTRAQTQRGVQALVEERTYSRMGSSDLILHVLALPMSNAIPPPKQTLLCFPAFCNVVCLPLNGTSSPITSSAPGASLFVTSTAHSSPVLLNV